MRSLGEKSFMYNAAESCQNMIVCIKKMTRLTRTTYMTRILVGCVIYVN